MRDLIWAAAVVAAFLLGLAWDPVPTRDPAPAADAAAWGTVADAVPPAAPGAGTRARGALVASVAADPAADWPHWLDRLDAVARAGDPAADDLRERLLRAILDTARGGEVAAAQRLLAAYLGRNPHDPAAFLLASDLQQMRGRADAALAPLLELLAFADDPAVVAEAREKLRLLVGVQETQLANAGDITGLVRLFRHLVDRDPGFDGHRLRLAHWLVRAGRLEDAERLLAETGSAGADPDARDYLLGQIRLARAGLPVERRGDSLHVTARVAGRSLRMLVDTGASITAISRQSAAALSGRPTGERVRVRTAGGVVESELMRLDDLEVGEVRLESPTVLVLEGPLPDGVDGLLGMDVLGRFPLGTPGLAR